MSGYHAETTPFPVQIANGGIIVNKNIRDKFDKEVQLLADRDGFKCQRCGKIFGDIVYYQRCGCRSDYGMVVDHIISNRLKWLFTKLSSYIDSIDNKQLLCIGCNVKKYHSEEDVVTNKYNVIHNIFSELKERKSMISRCEISEDHITILDNSVKECMVDKINEYGITKEDFMNYLKYRDGRLENNDKDFEDLKRCIEYVNFEFNNMR